MLLLYEYQLTMRWTQMEITKDMTITQVVTKFPKTVEVFRRHGMGCFG